MSSAHAAHSDYQAHVNPPEWHPGESTEHASHGHVIMSLFTLRVVLALLLFFTLLTSGVAELEIFISHAFNMEIPTWINVGIAIGIAGIKTALVVLFFMQLKYDNPLNLMIFIFTLLTVCFFLGFTGLDMLNRSTLDRSKGQYVIQGGTGLKGDNTAITDTATLDARATGKFNPEEMEEQEPEHLQDVTDSGYLPPVRKVGSSELESRPVTGLTLPMFVKAQPKEGEHEHKAE